MSAVGWAYATVLGFATAFFLIGVFLLATLRRERKKSALLVSSLEVGRAGTESAMELARKAIAEAQEQAALAKRYFAVIQGIESERDEWKQIAGTNVALYAGGLEACLVEIQRLSFVAKTEVNPVFSGIVQTYQKRKDIAAELPPPFDPAMPVGEYVAQIEAYRHRHEKLDTPKLPEKQPDK